MPQPTNATVSPAKTGSGYYVDHYPKCANCGRLLYGSGFEERVAGAVYEFCSDWCRDWHLAHHLKESRATAER